jgi:hypothetical protein
MPVCIAGMHRSGTSMLTSLLQACGLNLGPKKDLLPPAPENPEGFWESRSFLRINEHILRARDANWDDPPQSDVAGWENDPRLEPLHKQAHKLIRSFRGREPWGWKDPRNCLTLPFWQKALPSLKVLICVRNPLAVADSLWQRNRFSSAASLDLWLTYNQRVMAAAPIGDRLVTHCESYFVDPESELRRLLTWLGIPTSKDQVESACRRFNPSLMHHRMTVDDLESARLPPKVVACYRQLQEEAGCLPHRRGTSRRNPRSVGLPTGR